SRGVSTFCAIIGTAQASATATAPNRDQLPKQFIRFRIPNLSRFLCVTLRNQFHRLRIPMLHFAAKVAEIAQQSSAGGAISEHRIFNDRFAAPNRIEEGNEVAVD